MTAHTPGPWEVGADPDGNEDCQSVWVGSAGTQGEVAGRICEPANAQAIAALPALILALAGALEELDRHEPYSVTDPLIARRRAARAALQKAGVKP